MNRFLSLLLFLLPALLPLQGRQIYMGGHHGFSAAGLADSIVTLNRGERFLLPLTPAAGGEYTLITLIQNRSRQAGWLLVNEDGDTLRLNLHSLLSELTPNRFRLTLRAPGIEAEADSPAASESPWHSDFPASFMLRICPEGEAGVISLCEISDNPTEIFRYGALAGFLQSGLKEIGVEGSQGGRLNLHRICLLSEDPISEQAETGWDIDALKGHFEASADSKEGFWRVLDYSLDSNILRLSPDYLFALVRTPGGYKLLYLSGAHTPEWNEGMIKAELEQTAVPDAYRLYWRDISGNIIRTDARAQFDGPRVLTIQFPEYSATIRLHRAPEPAISGE